jgi:hypothetical protein
MPFENVPDWLTDKVRRLKDDQNQLDRHSIYFNAAGYVIGWYLRKDIRSASSDPFFELPGKDAIEKDHALWHAHVHRALLVGATIFELRNSRSFSELIDRLIEQASLRAAFFEMSAAKQFHDLGYEIVARAEKRGRGLDFDFTAITATQTINVEVTALTAPVFAERTIVNRFKDKVDQVPKDAPAILYCVLPDSWVDTPGIDWDEALGRLTRNFLRSTKRWNAVVFWCERHQELGNDTHATYLVRKPYLNERTYCPLNTDFLFRGPKTGECTRGEFEAEANNGEFYRWVDSLVA